MVTAILKFDLNTERYEHELALHGADWSFVVMELDNWLRGKLKHGNLHPEADAALQSARDLLYDWMAHYGVSLDDIP